MYTDKKRLRRKKFDFWFAKKQYYILLEYLPEDAESEFLNNLSYSFEWMEQNNHYPGMYYNYNKNYCTILLRMNFNRFFEDMLKQTSPFNSLVYISIYHTLLEYNNRLSYDLGDGWRIVCRQYFLPITHWFIRWKTFLYNKSSWQINSVSDFEDPVKSFLKEQSSGLYEGLTLYTAQCIKYLLSCGSMNPIQISRTYSSPLVVPENSIWKAIDFNGDFDVT